MSDIVCPRCGVTNSGDSAFCGGCGTPFKASAPGAPATGTPPAGWQPPAGGVPPVSGAPGAVAYPPPPAGAYPPPPGGYPPPPQGYPAPPPGYPPGAYPMVPATAKVIGNNTKWAFGLAVACFLIGAGLLSKINALMGLLAPVAAGAGVYMARKDMQDFASGRAPQLNEGVAKGAFWLNVVLLAFDIVMILYGVSKATG